MDTDTQISAYRWGVIDAFHSGYCTIFLVLMAVMLTVFVMQARQVRRDAK